jgi:diguanylate cyclase (GGDEF)-like protein
VISVHCATLMVTVTLEDDHQQATQIANRIQDELARPFTIAQQQLTVECSIGIALRRADDEKTDAGTLIHNADLAMYKAKQRGRARVELFDPTLVPAAA